jgi:WD40 repeat protein
MKFHQKIDIGLNEKESINFIEFQNDDLLFCSSDAHLLVYNLATKGQQNVYSEPAKSTIELGPLKCVDNNYLLSCRGQFLNVFDINNYKLITKYKFSKDDITCIDFQSKNVCACGDDSGEVKLIDVRIPSSTKSSSSMSMTMRTTLNKHENICSSLIFNPIEQNELLTGSFDCTINKWDLRYLKNKKEPIQTIDINEIVQKECLNDLVSSMTPTFVHCIETFQQDLFVGIENGLCLTFSLETFEFNSYQQLQPFNCALTNLNVIQYNNQEESKVNTLIIGSGNGKTIQFSQLTKDKSSLFKNIEHGEKINFMKFKNNQLFIADTTSQLTIYK